jgi:hypothetical protein
LRNKTKENNCEYKCTTPSSKDQRFLSLTPHKRAAFMIGFLRRVIETIGEETRVEAWNFK